MLAIVLSLLLPFLVTVTATPTLAPILNVTLNLGQPVPPIPIPGGVQIALPIINGTVSGIVNATIQGGLAYPTVYGSGSNTTQFPVINFYGVSSGGDGFLGQEAGIAVGGGQLTRVEITAGGQYANLTTAFIVCETQNRTQTQARIQCFQLTPGVRGVQA